MTDDKKERDGPRHNLKVDTSVTFEGVKVKSLADGHALNTIRQPQGDALKVVNEIDISAYAEVGVEYADLLRADLIDRLRAALEARGLEIREKGL
jgi:hypothetical protein